MRVYPWDGLSRVQDTNVMIGQNDNIGDMTLCGTFHREDRKVRRGYESYDITCGTSLTGRYVLVNKTTDNGCWLVMYEFEISGQYV